MEKQLVSALFDRQRGALVVLNLQVSLAPLNPGLVLQRDQGGTPPYNKILYKDVGSDNGTKYLKRSLCYKPRSDKLNRAEA